MALLLVAVTYARVPQHSLPALSVSQGGMLLQKGRLKLSWAGEDSMGLRAGEQTALTFILGCLDGFACKCFASLNCLYLLNRSVRSLVLILFVLQHN